MCANFRDTENKPLYNERRLLRTVFKLRVLNTVPGIVTGGCGLTLKPLNGILPAYYNRCLMAKLDVSRHVSF